MLLGKLDNNMQNNEIRPLSYMTHKNLLEIDSRPKCFCLLLAEADYSLAMIFLLCGLFDIHYFPPMAFFL